MVNFSTIVKLPCQDMFSVPVVVTPVASAPGAPAYMARGIFNTGSTDVLMTDGSMFSDQQTILDVRDVEYDAVPMQGDIIDIPLDCNGAPCGIFEVTDSFMDGGGQTTLSLKRIVDPTPPLVTPHRDLSE